MKRSFLRTACMVTGISLTSAVAALGIAVYSTNRGAAQVTPTLHPAVQAATSELTPETPESLSATHIRTAPAPDPKSAPAENVKAVEATPAAKPPAPPITVDKVHQAPAPVVRVPADSGHSTSPTPVTTVNQPWVDLGHTISDLLGQQPGTYGYSLVDLNTGATLGLNQDQSFPAASTFKLPLAIYILQQVDQGHADLNEKLTQTDDDYEDGTGLLQDKASGGQYTIGDLLDLAIEQSDNIAVNMLLRRFGGHSPIWAFQQQLGATYTHDGDNNNITSPNELNLYLRTFLDPKQLSDASRNRLLNALTHTAFPIRVAAGVPDGVPVAHKIGTLPNVVNDTALVQVPGHPFLLSICSENVGEDDADNVLAQVAKLAYTYFSQAH